MKPLESLRKELRVVIGICVLTPICLTGLMHLVIWMVNQTP